MLGSTSGSPTWTRKLVSLAPRSRRLNSSIFPRLRSQPIHEPSPGFHWRARWNRWNRSVRPWPRQAFKARTPARAASRISSSAGSSAVGASAKSPRMAKCMRGSTFPRARTSTCSNSSATPATLVSRVGTTTMVRASSGTPAWKSRRGGGPRGATRAARRRARAVADPPAGRGRGAGALHAAKGHAERGLAGGLRQLLHRLPVAVPAEEIHSPVDASRVALQDLFDQADVFEILRPVQGGAQPQAGDGVGHGDLPRRLPLVLRPNRILRCHSLGGEAFLNGPAHGRDRGPMLAHPRQQSHDVGRLRDFGEGRQGCRIFGAADLG